MGSGLLSLTIALFCVGGVALSYYAIHIEHMKSENNDYQATCDLDEKISCSKVVTSKYSRGMGIVGDLLGEDHPLNIPNSYGGLLFFPVMLVLGFIPSRMITFLAVMITSFACFTSVYLVYILFYILEMICLVCMPVHFINLALFILFTIKWSSPPGKATSLELPCMYVPAFSNPALVSSLAEIEQKCMVQLQVQYGSTCTKDVKSFSTMVSSKLVSHAAAAEVSSFGIALYQKKSTSGASNPPVSYVWSWKDDHHVYTQYDSVSSTKISEHYNSSPQGSLHLTIVTKLGSTSYVVDFATMKQTNLKTGHIRKIKKSSLENPDSLTWFYEDDSKKMAPYSASECVQIEEMYLSSKPSDLVINGKVYTFDFTTLKQINKNTSYERKIERNAPHLIFNLQIEGLQQNIVIAEKMLKEELDKAVVEKIHVLPTTTDNAFQTEVMTTLQKYFVLASVVGDTVQVRGVQGYVEKVMLIVREKTLDFEKECLARASSTPHSASVPSNWEVQTDKFALKEVLHSSSEWTEIKNRFHKTLPSTGIVSIKRIQNKWLWDRYSFAKQRMSKRNAGIVNEQMLFHGTRETPPEKIYNSEQGFDFRFSTKGMWGTGTYFAINASYSQSYSYSTIQGKQMILASVLTGETYRCPPDGSLKKPPIKPRKHGSFEDELFDSVSGQTKGSDVFIIYDHEKAYPCYLITFNRY